MRLRKCMLCPRRFPPGTHHGKRYCDDCKVIREREHKRNTWARHKDRYMGRVTE